MTKKIDMKIGFECNNHCKFCVQGDKRNYIGNQDKKLILSKIKNGIENGYDEIVFTGGEPTIYKQLIDYVKYAKKVGYKIIQIQSNGKNFSDIQYCEKIINAGATEFSPSLHGFDENTHDDLVGVKGSWKQTIKGIQNLKKLGQIVITNSVITKQNFTQLPKLAYLLISLGVDQFQLAFIHILGTARKNKKDIVPKKSDIQKYVFKAMEIGSKYGKTCMTEAIPFCFMQGYEKYISEYMFTPDAKIFDANNIIDSYKDYRINEGKIKGPPCQKCIKNNICEGPWKEYIDIYGWDEFKSITQ